MFTFNNDIIINKKKTELVKIKEFRLFEVFIDLTISARANSASSYPSTLTPLSESRFL